MSASPSDQQRLIRASRDGTLVRIERSVESGWATGYVCGVGDEFFLLCLVSDQIVYNGFQAFRLGHVADLMSPAPHAEFVERALSLRGLKRPEDPGVSLLDPERLVTSAASRFPLITLHREVVDPDVCHIGTISDVTDGKLTLQLGDPDARWIDEPEVFDLDDITRVDFGGMYAGALDLVARSWPTHS